MGHDGGHVARPIEDRDLGLVRPVGERVFLLDTIGELSRAYRLGRAAFIGGSLVPTGGHNPLEPAVWGVPVLNGPHIHNFTEVYREMLGAGRALPQPAPIRVDILPPILPGDPAYGDHHTLAETTRQRILSVLDEHDLLATLD